MDDIHALKSAINEVLDQRRAIPETEHRRDHDSIKKIDWEFLRAWIDEEKQKKLNREKIKTQIIGGVAIGAFFGFGGFVLWAVGEWVKHFGHRGG